MIDGYFGVFQVGINIFVGPLNLFLSINMDPLCFLYIFFYYFIIQNNIYLFKFYYKIYFKNIFSLS